MIRISREPSRPGGPVFHLDRHSDLHRSWNGVRHLLEDVATVVEREAGGRDALARFLGEHREVASLVLDDQVLDDQVLDDQALDDQVLDGLEPAPDAAALRAADGLAARLTSHLSHNWAVQRPLFDAWGRLLHDLLHDLLCEVLPDGGSATLFVSDLARLDWETLAAVKAVYRLFPDTSPAFRIHHDPRRPAPRPDADGLWWQTRPEYVAQAALGFQILPGAVTTAEASPEPPAEPRVASVTATVTASDTGRFLDGFDTRARDALRAARKEGRAPGADLDQKFLVHAVERSFQSFAFTTALRLGLDLLELQTEDRSWLDPRQAATVHEVVALCAHNRQFRTAGNQALADFLERHLVAALEAEDRPERRCAVLYRLGVAVGRRRGDLEAALGWCDRGVEEARHLRDTELSPLRIAYQDAWMRNIRAYVRMRLRRIADGARDLETAFEHLETAQRQDPPGGSAAVRSWTRDVELSHSLLAGNLAALAHLSGDREGAHRWRSVGHELSKGAPGIERYEASQWIVLCRDFHLPRMAVSQALDGLRGARRENDALWLHRLLTVTADLTDRVGRVWTTARLYRHAHRLGRELGGSPLLDRVELRAAAACSRTGRFAEARDLLVAVAADRRWPADPQTRSRRQTELQVEIHRAMALLAARAGSGETAEVSMETARRHAVRLRDELDGSSRALVRTLADTGLVGQLLGRLDAAAEAYRQILELRCPGDMEQEDLGAAEELRARLGLEEIEGPEAGRLEPCLQRLPQALRDTEAWWDLARLLEALGRGLEAGTFESTFDREAALGSAPGSGRDLLALASCQRRDCSDALAALSARWPALGEAIGRSRDRLCGSILEAPISR